MAACKKALDPLTALKGLFCLVIAVHNTLAEHYLFADIPGTSFVLLFGGTMGNSLFFMISGFLFAYNYHDRIQNQEILFQDFLLRRLRKLYPLYLITNFISLLINILWYGPSSIDLSRIASIMLLQNLAPYNSPTWFLAALFLCYLLFYFISYHAKGQTQYRCAIAFFALFGFSLISDLPFLGARYCFAYSNFFLGCVLAECYPAIIRQKNKGYPHICLFLLMGIGILFLKYGAEVISGSVEQAFTLVVSPMILYIALSDGIYARILQVRPLVFLGKISTHVYFWHMPVYFLFRECLPGKTVWETQYLVYILLLLIFSILSWRIFENRRLPAAKAENSSP